MATGICAFHKESMPLKTRIICTIGPSCEDAEILARMSEAGMGLVRINSGHCTPEEVPVFISLVKEASRMSGRNISVLLDLQGPRLRIGMIAGGSIDLESGQLFRLSSVPVEGDSSRVHIAYDRLAADISPGDRILVDDGLISLLAVEIAGQEVVCEVVKGGPLLQGKGMNFPDSILSLAAYTERDKLFLETGLNSGVDWVAQSFVRRAEDLEELHGEMKKMGRTVPVIAKIEKPEAVDNIAAILKIADGIMVARGDLGVEMEVEEVPLVQKELIRKSIRAAKPVVTATQMLESMIENPRPTRAEASDVANAILDGTDGVMLSAETAIGAQPVEVVRTMAKIAARTEKALDYENLLERSGRWEHVGDVDALGFAACKVAYDIGAKAIVCLSRSGYTARLIARYRPQQPIIALSPDSGVSNMIALVWGTHTRYVPEYAKLADLISEADCICSSAEGLSPGDRVVFTGGLMESGSSDTNLIHVHTMR